MVPVRLAKPEDYRGWLTLAREVEPLFGPMVDDPWFCSGLKKAIGEGNALCADLGRGDLAGGLVISREANEIAWFAVAEESRGQGLGKALLSQALKLLESARPVILTTFALGVEAGAPARKLYLSFGFRDTAEAGCNPAGIPVVAMVRPATPGEAGAPA